VETSSFGSEFVAMKQCCEYLRGMRYKLRMMGIAVNGPYYISGDNQSVLANTTEPGSTLKKKSQSIAYHFVREGVAKDEWRTSYVNTHEKEADMDDIDIAQGNGQFDKDKLRIQELEIVEENLKLEFVEEHLILEFDLDIMVESCEEGNPTRLLRGQDIFLMQGLVD
jgi:hypothetical protein